MRNTNPATRKSIRLIAAGYAALMLYLLLCRPVSDEIHLYANFIPLRTMKRYLYCLTPPWNPWQLRWAVINLFGNILMFLPLGCLPPLLWRWAGRLHRTLLFSLGVMTTVEFLQMFLRVGTCDVDDLILNTSGAAIGYWTYFLFFREKNEHQ